MRGAGGGWNRGQAIQIGALLLFAILLISLSLFQVFVVPSQNGEIEFKHSQEVRSDVLGVRNAVLDAATGDQSFVEVSLGPTYPSRSLFVNPGEPAGTIRTTERQPVTIINDTGGSNTNISDDACPGSTSATRALEYGIGYNVYDEAPTYRVEHTVLFRNFSSDTLPGSDQRLVGENSITLLPIRNEFSESGTGTATVEPVPGGTITTPVSDARIELPTAYDEATWKEILEEPRSRGDVTVSVDESTTPNTLVLAFSGEFTLYCSPVGVNGPPPSGARQGSLVGGSGGTGSINPASASQVQLVSVSKGQDNGVVNVTLRNTASRTKSLSRGRIPFYYTGGQSGDPTEAVLNDNASDTLRIREQFERIDENIVIARNGGEVTLSFDFDDKARDDLYVFEAVFDDGTSADYYIDTPKSQGGNNPTATATATGNNPGFSSVSVENIPRGSTGTAQTVTFSPDSTLPQGETVTVTLDDAQGVTGSEKPNPVDYQPASVDTGASTLQGGSASLSASTNTASITYTASGRDVASSETVTIELTGVETRDGNAGPFTVPFSRSDGGSTSGNFSLT
ncbi:hypothetical protein BRC89_03915 [Halobacteriales archaeon QS_4_70_19]|nr:MAG: hypothetical protein BRC89_03915 [Halobacteriales archaeon QS_4_70_19]